MDTVSMLNKMSFYCQPILPLVYDESMSYYETLCKVVGQLNTTGDVVNKLNEGLTGEIADRQAADAELSERLKKIEEQDKRIHFLVFDGANPNGAMPTRTEFWNWVREGDIICALYSANDATRGDVYAASCNYNAGDWATENSSDFHFLIPLETTYDSAGKLAVKQKIVKLTIPSYTKKNLNVPWGEEIIEINTPHTSAEGVVNFTATVVGETVTANITPADFIRLFDAASVTSKLCVGVNARLNYNALELGSSVATVYDNSSAKREVRITFVQDPHAGRRDYVPSEIFDLVNLVGDKDANTWKVETFGTELFDFQRYEGFQFTRKTGNVIEAAEDCDPASVAQYYNDLPGKDYQNLPVHLIDEVDNADYWNGTFDSYDDGHITFTFITSNYATIGEKMVVRVIELSATRTGAAWIGNEKWVYAAKEFDIPYRPTSYLLDVWKANETPAIDGGLVSYEGGSTLDFDDILPLVQGNQNFVATLHNGTSESGPELSGLIYSKMNVANGIGSITFAATEGVSLNNGIPSMNGVVTFSKDASGAKKVTITFSSALPVPSADGTDNGKVPTVNGKKWELKAPTGGVQSDWNQNDKTQPDYVKNRPFYTGNPVETVLVEESTVTFKDAYGMYRGQLESTFSPTVGETYKVSWDGTAYECAGVDFSGTPVIGNLSIAGAGADTGEPFLIEQKGSSIDIYTPDTSDSHTFSISRFAQEVVKIDEKYLPEAATVDTAMSDTSTNAVQNKVIKKYVDDHAGGTADAVLYTAQTLTDAQKKQARENVDAASDFVITATPDSSRDGVTLDKTESQIKEAISAGKTPVIRFLYAGSSSYLQLLTATENTFIFGGVLSGGEYGGVLTKIQIANGNVIARSQDLLATNQNGELDQITMAYPPVEDMQIATKQYVDDHVGGTSTNVTLSGNIEGDIKGYTSATYQQITNEIASNCNIWLTISGETVRLASYKQSGASAYTLVFFGAGVGALTVKYEVTASASSASLTVTGS